MPSVNSLSSWTRTQDGYATEASSLGLRPGQAPGGFLPLPDNRLVMFASDWRREERGGEVVAWAVCVGGVTYTIFND
jgi:hypothetical protein